MKLGILSALWNRPQLTMLFLDRLAHLKKELGVIPVVAGTDNQFEQDCKNRGITYRDCANKPLGAKWNYGMLGFKDLDITHVMIMGSDDFANDDFIKFAMDFSEDKDFTGCKDLYMYGANEKRRGYRQLFYFSYSGFLVGPGRIYSKRIIEMMNYTPWNVNRNSGLDGSITKSVRMLGGTVIRGSYMMKDNGLFLVDIKTLGNISGIPGGAKEIDDKLSDILLKNLPLNEANNLITHLKNIEAL